MPDPKKHGHARHQWLPRDSDKFLRQLTAGQ